MTYIKRLISSPLKEVIKMGKSALLLGPRQTGKTTLIKQNIEPDLSYTFLDAKVRRRFESDPMLLISEIKGARRLKKT